MIENSVRTPTPGHDPVNSPAHYTYGKIEVIDAIEGLALGFHEGNVVKYVARFRRKDGLTDLLKARWYLDRLIANVRAETTDLIAQPIVGEPDAKPRREQIGTVHHIAIDVDIDRFTDAVLERDWLPVFSSKCATVTELRGLCREARARGQSVFAPCDETNADGSCAGHPAWSAS